jgi:hypothetical protein
MGDIQYRKEFIIKKKILREDDILRLANLIHNQFQQGDYNEEYNIIFDDQSSITGRNNLNVFKTYEFKRRRCSRLCFTYKSKNLEKSIEIDLYNSVNTLVDSNIEVRSNDKDWFNSICNEISTIISEMERQKLAITFSTKVYGSMVLGPVEGFLVFSAFERVFPNVFTKSQFSSLATVASMILCLINYSCEKVRVPDLQEQTAIAQVLSTADREISLLRQDIEQEKQKKKALMQLLLTGIVRVKT